MFADRADAGIRLANALMEYQGQPVVVYALPRGGVVLGAKVAHALAAPLDLILVRKIGHPESTEYAIGAVTEQGDVVLNPLETRSISRDWLEQAIDRQLAEARRQREVFLHDRSHVSATGKVAILVDDGLATGLTMEAAIAQVRKQQPARVVVAVPVAAAETAVRLQEEVDAVVALVIPTGSFRAVGSFYRNFDQVSDDAVIALMAL
jgi:predicted phosphoribosyltransferase